jgi:hypothetical protein
MARARDLVYLEFNMSLPNFIESQGGSSEVRYVTPSPPLESGMLFSGILLKN